ncbi:MAG: asparagine synthase (glutamine-hydrolyzing) [Acidimicrobiia bacterium]
MCGVIGAVGDVRPEVLAAVEQQCAALAHRGPDAQGIWHDDDAVLGHRRLSIIDLSTAANQPVHDRTARYALVFNGEIYNFRALAGSAASSDTLSLLEPAGGPDGGRDGGVPNDDLLAHHPDRLRGMFAYALWDRQEQRLLLARDRFGMKPLYVSRHGSRLAFGSTAHATSIVAGRRPSPHPGALASFLRFGAVQGPATIFTGVEEIDPGTYATYSDGGLTTRRYWRYVDERPATGRAGDIRAVLQTSVAAHAISDQPLALFLSGGLDSAVIAALAAELDLDITAITLAFPGTTHDETTEAAITAKQLGLPHRIVEHADTTPDFDAFFAAMDQPTVDGMNTYLVSAAAHTLGYRVALTGIGADELFGGYNNFRRIPALAALNALTPGPLGRRILERSGGNRGKAQELVEAGTKLPALHAELRSVFASDEVYRLTGHEFPTMAPPARAAGLADQISRLEVECYLRNTLLRDADVFAMAHSVEIRTPFVDHHVVRAARAIPGRHKLRFGKRVLADAVGGQRLQEIVRRPKTGFTVPYAQWLRGPLADRVDDLLNGPLGETCDMNEVARHLASWRREETAAIRIWALVVLDAWLRRNAATPGGQPASCSTRSAT